MSLINLSTLPSIRGKYKLDYNLSHLTWFKVGGEADVFFKPKDLDDLTSFLQQNANNTDNQLPITILGAGSNLIIRDKGVAGVVIKLGQGFTDIEILANNKVSVGAGCLNFNLAKFTQANFIKNFEFLIGIPGTIGGGIAMNAGAYGSEFKDIVDSVHAINHEGKLMKFNCHDLGFSYRKNTLADNLIFTKVIFNAELGNFDDIKYKMDEINKNRQATQPITEKTGGSTFANPDGHKAWQLIDSIGFRGKNIKGVSMSPLHCNFMINDGNATASNMEKLGELIIAEVKNKLNIKLEWEIKRIGRNE